MHRKLLQVIAGIIMLSIGSIVVFSPVPRVYADPLLQNAPNLEGYKFYLTESSGETSRFDRSADGISRFAGLLTDLGADLQTLEWRTAFPTDADLLIIAGPRQEFDASQTARLWTYISEGGKVLLLSDPLHMEGDRARGLTSESGLSQLLWTDLGVRFSNNIVTTEGIVESLQAAVEVSAPVVEATEDVSTPVAETTDEAETEANSTPLAATTQPTSSAPIIDFSAAEVDNDQPILQGINDPLAFFGARSIEIDLSIREFPVQPIVFSDVDFYGEQNLPVFYENGLAIYNIGQDTPSGFLPLVAAYESGDTNTRLVMIGDRDFATNGGGLQSSPPNTGAFLYPGNVRFLLNSIAWLLNTDPVTVTFPTPGPTSTPTLIPTIEVIDPLAIETDLSIGMSVSNIRPVEGEIIIYNITVINNGPEAALNIVVSDELPRGISFVLASGGVYNSETGKWLIEQLEPSQAVTLRLVVSVLRGTVNTTITNVAQVSSDILTDTDTNNNATTVDIEVSGVSSGASSTTGEIPLDEPLENQQSQEGG